MANEWYKDYAAIQRRTPAGAGGTAWAAYLRAKDATSESYGAAFRELEVAAQQEGVVVNKPFVNTSLSQAQYQEALSQYMSSINNEVLKKNVTLALKDVQNQGANAGANIALPSIANLTAANAQAMIDSYVASVNQAIYSSYVTGALKDLQAQAANYGVSVAAPTISSSLSQASAQAIVDNYANQINSALLVKSTQDALKNVQSQAVSLGVTLAPPAVSAGITETAANALIENYVNAINSRLSTSVQAVSGVSVVKDSNGSLAIAESLYNQLIEAQTKYKTKWNDYSGIPEQVINSQATDVRINSDGNFEWTPVTAADKKQLAEINAYRTSSGLVPRTTLVLGPDPSSAYSAKWYSSGGGNRGTGSAGVTKKDSAGNVIASYDYDTVQRAPIGSGDIKIANIKASSAVNNSATAIKNIAQDLKAIKLTQAEVIAREAAAHPGQIKLKDGTWIDQIERKGNSIEKEAITIYSSKAERDAAMQDLKALSLAAEQARSNYKNIELGNGKYIDPVQKVGKSNTGENAVTVFSVNKNGNVVSRSGTANEYKKSMETAKKIAAMPITIGMSKADQEAILQAREYYNSRAVTPINFSPQDENSKYIETNLAKFGQSLDRASKAGTEGQRLADYLKEVSGNEVNLKEDLTAGINPYIQGGKTILSQMDKGMSLEALTDTSVWGLKQLNNIAEGKVGKNAVSGKIDKSLTWVDESGVKTLNEGVVQGIDDVVDYSPLALLNDYAKNKYGESGYTKAVDVGLEVVKTVPKNLYKSVAENPASFAVSAGVMYAGGAALGGAMGAGKSLLISGAETAFINPFAKATLKTGIAALEGLVQGYMVTEIGKQTIDTVGTGNADKIADFVTEFAIGGVGFSKGSKYFEGKLVSKYGDNVINSYNPLRRLAILAGEPLGIVRGKTVPIENSPYHPVDSQAALIESVISKDTVSGARGTAVHRFYQEIQGNPIGIKTYDIPIINKKVTAGRTLRALSGIRDQYLTRQNEFGRIAEPGAKNYEYLKQAYSTEAHTSYMVPDMTGGKYEAVGVHFLQKGGKSKINQEVQLLKDIPTVASELSELQKMQIREQFAKQGHIDPKLWKETQRLAAEKSKRIGQPVATITPKTGSGNKPESEVFLVFGDKTATEVTGSKTVGYTADGIKIKKVRLGTQEAIKNELGLLENIKYNWKNALSGNDIYAEGMAKAINRKIAEENGKEYMKPNQYGAHGVEHTGKVAKMMEELWYKSPTLQQKYTLKEFKVAGRLHDAARIYGSSKNGETEPIAHGPAVAQNIRKGRVVDKELNSLSIESQLRVADAIETHMWLQPRSILQATFYRASDFQKALVTADRLTRAGSVEKLKPGSTFKLPEERQFNIIRKSVSEGVTSLRQDTTAEFLPNRTAVELKNLEKIRDVSEYEDVGKFYTDYAYKNFGNQAKMYGSIIEYQNDLAKASKYLQNIDNLKQVPGYKKPEMAAKSAYYGKAKDGTKSGYSAQPYESKYNTYKPAYKQRKVSKPSYVTPYTKKADYDSKYVTGGKYTKSKYSSGKYGKSGYSSGYSGNGRGYKPGTEPKPPVLPSKLKLKSRRIKVYTNRAYLERDIKNVLGSLQSMLG